MVNIVCLGLNHRVAPVAVRERYHFSEEEVRQALVRLKAAGVPMIGYGDFITQAVNFVIVAFIIFLLVKAINKAFEKPAEEAPAAPAGPTEVELLAEIRDALRAKG